MLDPRVAAIRYDHPGLALQCLVPRAFPHSRPLARTHSLLLAHSLTRAHSLRSLSRRRRPPPFAHPPLQLLEETAAELKGKFPDVEIEAVGVDLSRPGCLQVVEKVADGKNVQLLFCNAGFMISGFFADCPLGKSQANLGVNVACHLDLTHHFVNKMLAAGDRGAVFFTSSPAWMLPSPTAAMYAGEPHLIMFSVWRELCVHSELKCVTLRPGTWHLAPPGT